MSDGLPAAWSPDGGTIAYSVNDGSAYWIESLDVASGSHVRVVDGLAPAWSPDGLLFTYRGGPSRSEVWTAGADGSSPRRLAAGSGPVWSAQGLIAYFSDGGQPGANDIWVIDPDVTDPVNVTNSPDDEFTPSWSPDGSRLAFDRGTAQFSSNDVVVARPDGSDQVTLVGDPVTGGAPVWSPDGSLIESPHFDAQEGENELEVFDTSGQGPGRSIPAPGHLGWDSWQVLP